MVLCEDRVGFFAAVMRGEPAGRFGDEAFEVLSALERPEGGWEKNSQDEGDLQERRDKLEKGGDAPAPVAGDVVGAEADGSGDDLADEVGDVEEGGEHGSFLGVGKLADEGGA